MQLNEDLIQDDLLTLILLFLTYWYSFMVDTKLMYQMNLIEKSQCDLKRTMQTDRQEVKMRGTVF